MKLHKEEISRSSGQWWLKSILYAIKEHKVIQREQAFPVRATAPCSSISKGPFN